MTTIHLDDQIASELQAQAQKAGVSVPDYLRSLLPVATSTMRPDWEELERDIEALSSLGPSLPADFSRADIYDDHD